MRHVTHFDRSQARENISSLSTHGGTQQTSSTSCFRQGIVKGEKKQACTRKNRISRRNARAFALSMHAAGNFHARQRILCTRVIEEERFTVVFLDRSFCRNGPVLGQNLSYLAQNASCYLAQSVSFSHPV